MDYEKTARELLGHVGGPANIESVTHCFTRLRFVLKNFDLASHDSIRQTEGVISVLESGGQLQVVLGAKVNGVYEALLPLLEASPGSENSDSNAFGNGNSDGENSDGNAFSNGNSGSGSPADNGQKSKGKDASSISSSSSSPTLFNRLIMTVSAIFTPIVPAIAASGLLKGILTIVKLLAANQGIDVTANQTYIIFLAATDALFYFMPIILAYAAARVFKANEFVAMALAGTMCYPALVELMTGGESVTMFGLSVTKANYTSSVIPILIGVFILSYLQRFLERVIPEVLKIILVPGISLLVMVPATYLVFGPIGIYIGNGIHIVYTALMDLSPVICGAFVGGMWCVFVIFGAHRALIPIGINDVALNGRQNLLAFAGAANFSQGGAALGVMLRTKNRDLRTVAASASLSATVCGITEPAIYGCNLRLKRPMYYAILCGAAGGAIMGAGGVYGDAFANNGILTLATYAAFGMKRFLFYLAGIAVSFFGAALLTYLFGFDDGFFVGSGHFAGSDSSFTRVEKSGKIIRLQRL